MSELTTVQKADRKADAEKLLHIMKMHIDFDELELVTPASREIWNEFKSDIELVCSKHSIQVHVSLINE